MNTIKLQVRPELLQQWQQDVERNPTAFAAMMARSPEFVAALVHDATAASYLDALVNNAHTSDFLEATRLEAAHQVVRWGEAHDRGKSAENWFWLVGYLAGKCLRACITGDREKALHHTISSAAALLNWHKAIGKDTTGTGIAADDDIRPVEIARFEDDAAQIDERFAAAHYGHDLFVGGRAGDGMVGAATARVRVCSVSDAQCVKGCGEGPCQRENPRGAALGGAHDFTVVPNASGSDFTVRTGEGS